MKLFIWLFGNILSIYRSPERLLCLSLFVCLFVWFLNAFPSGEYVNLACFIIWLLSEGNTSLPVIRLSAKLHKLFKINIWWMINCHLLKLLFIWNFYYKVVCRIWPNRFWYSKIRLCYRNKRNAYLGTSDK